MQHPRYFIVWCYPHFSLFFSVCSYCSQICLLRASTFSGKRPLLFLYFWQCSQLFVLRFNSNTTILSHNFEFYPSFYDPVIFHLHLYTPLVIYIFFKFFLLQWVLCTYSMCVCVCVCECSSCPIHYKLL